MEIRTERLLLRPYTLADVDVLHSWHSRADVVRYLYWEPVERERAEQMVRRRLELAEPPAEVGDSMNLAVQLADTVLGEVHLERLAHNGGEIGYVFAPESGGNGYATEAARAMLWLGFESLGMHRIIGRCDADHVASRALLRKLGMREEAHFVDNEFVKGAWTSEAVYAMLASEWPGAGAAVS